MKLILVRHGQTDWAEKRYQGITDIELSKGGIEQAIRIAERLKKEKIDVAYTSRLKRAIQTAKEIVKSHKIRLIKTGILNERSYGRWAGLTKKEVEERYPVDYLNYKKDKYKIKPTKGESLFELRKRIEPFIKEIIRENSGKTALVIAHNGPLRIIIGILNNYNGKKIASLHLKPASLTIIKIAE